MYDRDKPQWTCSFRGEADWSFRGKQYQLRCSAVPGDGKTATSDDGWYNGDYYFRGILPAVGTIMNDHGGYHEFPCAEVCAFFPDYVPAKWSDDFSQIIYQGEKPETVTLSYGHVWGKRLLDAHEAKYGPVGGRRMVQS